MVRSKGPPSTKHHWTCSQAQMGSKWLWLSTWGRLGTSKHTSKSNVFQRFGKHFFQKWRGFAGSSIFKEGKLVRECWKNPPPKKKLKINCCFSDLFHAALLGHSSHAREGTHLSGDLSIESYWSYGTSPDWKWPKVIQLEHVFDTPQKRLANMLRKTVKNKKVAAATHWRIGEGSHW